MTLSPDGSYALRVTDDAGQAVIDAMGTFQVRRAMTLQVVLSGMEPAPMCTVSEAGLNLSIALPGMTATSDMGGLGFSLKKTVGP